MRKIENQIIDSLEKQENKTLSKRDKVDNGIYYLWDSPIVELKDNSISFCFCGYGTTTTKQRISNILYHFTKKSVYQKNYQFYINDEKIDIYKIYSFEINK